MLSTTQQPVTGKEKVEDEREPLSALSQFYRALNSRDMLLMDQNWDASDDVVMDNPLGGIKRGWPEIRSVYARLFATRGRFQFEFYDYTLQRYAEAFIAIGRERGHLEVAGGDAIELAIRTTRVFRWTGERWRQVHHHGSIDNPEMLARYQKAVLGSS
jgi:SnoaL-like domain